MRPQIEGQINDPYCDIFPPIIMIIPIIMTRPQKDIQFSVQVFSGADGLISFHFLRFSLFLAIDNSLKKDGLLDLHTVILLMRNCSKNTITIHNFCY